MESSLKTPSKLTGCIRVTTDAVIVKNQRILLIKRGIEPFKGKWALPGGHVEYSERVEDACAREALEETGLKVKPEKLVGVYSDPKRDPRGHSVGITYLCKIIGGAEKAGDDASETMWFPLGAVPKLAFDHDLMVADAKKMLRQRKKSPQ